MSNDTIQDVFVTIVQYYIYKTYVCHNNKKFNDRSSYEQEFYRKCRVDGENNHGVFQNERTSSSCVVK